MAVFLFPGSLAINGESGEWNGFDEAAHWVGLDADNRTVTEGWLLGSVDQPVVLNLTAVRTTGTGFVTGWPSDESQPGSSNLNVREVGINIANLAVLPLRTPSGKISLFTLGGAHLLADTSGYFL